MVTLFRRPGLLTALAFTAFIANPNMGCSGSSEDGFSYSEADMKDVAVGTFTGELTLDGKTESFTLVLEQANAQGAGSQTTGYRPLCGSRTFVAPAAACMSMSQMLLVGTLTSDDQTFDGAKVEGEYTAYANLNGQVTLEVEGHGQLTLNIEDGALTEGDFTPTGGGAQGTVQIDQR